MKVTAIVQARMGSTRLPNKVMMPIEDGTPLIEILLSRLSKSSEIDQIILATSALLQDKTPNNKGMLEMKKDIMII